ncbi:MAG: DUF2892 domain-containing protein [Leptospirales bacterium]|nr:DUF2892 domain-containing protein [Leptospirales bacterium]
MKKNMGTIDRTLRVLLAVAAGVLWYTGVISGTVAIVLGVISVILIATSLVGSCPLYLPFGLSTRGKQ